MKRQCVHTFDEIISLENLCAAWQNFSRGKRGKQDAMQFGHDLANNLVELHNDLRHKTYRHGPYERFNVSDPKPRIIHKASVRDRVVHHALYRVLYPFFDGTFIADSYSCRVGKGTHAAISRFGHFARQVSQNNTRTCWVLSCDIKKFFANIDHAILMRLLAAYIPSPDIRWLCGQIIFSFSSSAEGVGVPLGNLTSQLFVNIYMNEFDQWMKHGPRARRYLRFADDFVWLIDAKEDLIKTLPRLAAFLQERLRLALHPDKIRIKTLASGVAYLGWVHFPRHRVLRTATKQRMLRRILAHPTRETMASYHGLLQHGNAWQLRGEVFERYWLINS